MVTMVREAMRALSELLASSEALDQLVLRVRKVR